MLLIFNLVFYWMLSGKGILVLCFLAVSDFTAAKLIYRLDSGKLKALILYCSVLLNIGLILTFRHFTDWFHLHDYDYWPSVIGVSFFVFRSMGYVLDVYRETIDEPENNLLRYFTWISFFPLIMAGPISPARDFLPQLKTPYNGSTVPVNRAFFLLSSGIVKKYIVSNYLAANFVNRVFDSPSFFTGLENLLAAIGQALVVYMDFSGYTDLMLGMALLLGFSISENFNFPYLAGNITEYWRRWHISLSKWLNEYLFFPLSFMLRKLKKWGTVIAVMITFIISGFWHGTAFHYTFWGILHALALGWDVVSQNFRSGLKRKIRSSLYNPISIFLTFSFLVLSGIFFKAPSLENGYVMFHKIFLEFDPSFFTKWFEVYPWVFVILLVVLVWQWSMEKPYGLWMAKLEEIKPVWMSLILVLIIFLAYQVTGLESLPFIYLEF